MRLVLTAFMCLVPPTKRLSRLKDFEVIICPLRLVKPLKVLFVLCLCQTKPFKVRFDNAQALESVNLWYQGGDLNSRPPAYETSALTS